MDNKSIIEKDKKYVWHPFTQEKLAKDNVPMVSGKGSWLKDADGNEYLDLISSWWVNTHGHSHPEINKAIQDQVNQLEHIIFAGFTHPKGVELSERLIHKLGGHFAKVFFSDNGSTANEVALKMCFQYFYNNKQVKPKVIAFNGSYHGDTFGSMSTSTRNEFNIPFAKNLFDVYHIDVPNAENFDDVKEQFKSFINKGDVAAFVFEPLVLGVAGMQMYNSEYLDKLISICKESDVLTIADEVFTGFYRTGKMFSINHLQNQPDFICLSKGITAGYLPLGVTITTQKVYDAFYSDDRLKTFFHGHSYTGNPISCAVACKSLDIFEQQNTIANIKAIENWNHSFLAELKDHKAVKDARVLGTILAFEIVNDDKNSYFNPIGGEVYDYFMERKLMIRPLGSTVYILPPYCFTNEEYLIGKNAIVEFLDKLVGKK